MTVEIDVLELSNAIKKLNLNYPTDEIQIFAEKDYDIVQQVIQYIKDEPLKKENFTKIVVWIEYIAIITMGMTDIFAKCLQEILSIKVKRNIYFQSVEDSILANDPNSIEYKIKNQMINIENSKEFKYINALSNYIKHNGGSSIKIYILPETKIAIKPFNYRGNLYQEEKIDNFFDYYYKLIENLLLIFKEIIDFAK